MGHSHVARVAHALLALVSALGLLVSLQTAREMAGHRVCRLGLEFEYGTVTTHDVRWLPPTARCVYEGEGVHPAQTTETHWELYAAAVPLSIVIAVLLHRRVAE
jgi:hypothetical protein